MTALLVVCFLGLQAGFIWARYAIFRVDGRPAFGLRLIEASATACLIAGTWLIANRTESMLALDLLALTMAACSAGLFAWALHSIRPRQLTVVFSADAPAELLQHGAFAFVRNPFYLAYMLGFAIPAVVSGTWSGLMLAVWMSAIYAQAVRLEERKFLAGPLAEEYLRYCAGTGRFLPRIVKPIRPSGARHGH